jgi:hypothetical protein
MKGPAKVAVFALAMFAASLQSASARPEQAPSAVRVLVFTKTVGFRHSSIPSAVQALRELGAQNGFAIEATDDSGAFTESNLARYAAVAFALTTGDVGVRALHPFGPWVRRPPFRLRHRVLVAVVRAANRRLLQEPSGDPTRDARRRRSSPSLDGAATATLDAHGRVVQLRDQSAPIRSRTRDDRRDDLRPRRRRDGPRSSDRLGARVRGRTRLVHGRRAHRRVLRRAALPGAPAGRHSVRGRAGATADPLDHDEAPGPTGRGLRAVRKLHALRREHSGEGARAHVLTCDATRGKSRPGDDARPAEGTVDAGRQGARPGNRPPSRRTKTGAHPLAELRRGLANRLVVWLRSGPVPDL